MGRIKKNITFNQERTTLAIKFLEFKNKLTNLILLNEEIQHNILDREERRILQSILTKITNFTTRLNPNPTNQLIRVLFLNFAPYHDSVLNTEFFSVWVNDKKQLPTHTPRERKDQKRIIFANEKIAKYYLEKKVTNNPKKFLLPKIKPNEKNEYWIYRIHYELEPQ